MAKNKAKDTVLKYPVTYSNVSIGDETARVGVSINRANLTPGQADKTVCAKRLTIGLLARTAGQAGQESLPGLEADHELEGVADVMGFGVTAKKISFGLTFKLGSIDVSVFAKFAKREGFLTIFGMEEIPDDEGNEEGDE